MQVHTSPYKFASLSSHATLKILSIMENVHLVLFWQTHLLTLYTTQSIIVDDFLVSWFSIIQPFLTYNVHNLGMGMFCVSIALRRNIKLIQNMSCITVLLFLLLKIVFSNHHEKEVNSVPFDNIPNTFYSKNIALFVQVLCIEYNINWIRIKTLSWLSVLYN